MRKPLQTLICHDVTGTAPKVPQESPSLLPSDFGGVVPWPIVLLCSTPQDGWQYGSDLENAQCLCGPGRQDGSTPPRATPTWPAYFGAWILGFGVWDFPCGGPVVRSRPLHVTGCYAQ